MKNQQKISETGLKHRLKAGGWEIVFGGCLLLIFSSLLYIDYTSQIKLQQNIQNVWKNDCEQYAIALTRSLTELSHELERLIEDRAVLSYFESKSLGMSRQYGLGLSFLSLRDNFDSYWQEKNAGNAPFLSYLIFSGSDGILLYEKMLPGSSLLEIFSDTASCKKKKNPHIHITEAQNRFQLSFTIPLFINNNMAGILHAGLSQEKGQKLHDIMHQYWKDEETITILSEGTKSIAFPESLTPEQIHSLFYSIKSAQTPFTIHHARLNGEQYTVTQTPIHLLHDKMQITIAVPAKSLGLNTKSSPLFLAMGLLFLLVFSGLLISLRNRTRYLILENRLEESVKRKKELTQQIQQRIKAQNSLMLAQKNTEAILDALQDAMFVIRQDGTIIETNQGVTSILGYTGQELKDKNIRSICLEPEHANCFFNSSTLSVKMIMNMETSFRHKNGSKVTLLLSANPINTFENDIEIKIICLGKDVTRLRETELRLEKQARLAHSGRLTALGEMATGIAHEINQPLTIIHLAAQFLLKPAGKGKIEEQKEAAVKIMDQVKRATKIITNMRFFARASNDTINAINLCESIEVALSFFYEQFRLHQIKFSVTLDQELPKVKIDPQKFQQIVVNLLSNARYAVEKRRETSEDNNFQPHIEVRLFRLKTERLGCFEVNDNGVGMSEKVLDKCQEPFFTTKEVGQGTGLGLSIIQNIIREFDGKMMITSKPDQGSCFRISFPIYSDKTIHGEEKINTQDKKT
ncbi:MAG: PAS domain S-box protein [Desulfobulbaceae bacterium]|nr:PAS domain S-box protein [Desulfobulbaceae bacterium]